MVIIAQTPAKRKYFVTIFLILKKQAREVFSHPLLSFFNPKLQVPDQVLCTAVSVHAASGSSGHLSLLCFDHFFDHIATYGSVLF